MNRAKAYQTAWWLIWSAVAATAIAIACMVWTPLVVAATFLMAAAAVWCVAMLWVALAPVSFLGQQGFCGCVWIGVWGGVGVLAMLSLAEIAEALAWPLLALAAGTSPAAVRWVRRQLRAARRRRTDGRLRLTLEPAFEDRAWERILAEELAQLSDFELCRAWRASYLALGESPDPAWRCQVVRVRQAYLAELEWRHPAQVAAWLETCPRPAAGPERFLRSAAGDQDQDAA